MKTSLSIEPHIVYLWRVFIPDCISKVEVFSTLLSLEEELTASRFYFFKDRHRYIITRGILRQILSLYLNEPPELIHFHLGPHGKPYLQNHSLHFNLSHSNDMIVYGFVLNHEIGIDIEKIKPQFNPNIALKFFSQDENTQLNRLQHEEKNIAFYQLWSAKEAVIKMLGLGLYMPITKYSLDYKKEKQHLILNTDFKNCYVEKFVAHPSYRSTFATSELIEKKQFWEWKASGPQPWIND